MEFRAAPREAPLALPLGELSRRNAVTERAVPTRCHSEPADWRENPPVERYSGTTSLAPRIYEGGEPRSGRGSPPPQRREPSQSRFARQLSRRESRGGCAPITGHSHASDRRHWRENSPDERYSGTISLAPRIYEGGGPRSGRGSPPPQRREPSQSRFARQLSRRESRGGCVPITGHSHASDRSHWRGNPPDERYSGTKIRAGAAILPPLRVFSVEMFPPGAQFA